MDFFSNTPVVFWRHNSSICLLIKINTGNKIEWSLIRSVIIRVINKIVRPRIGRHEILLQINHKN